MVASTICTIEKNCIYKIFFTQSSFVNIKDRGLKIFYKK